VQGRSYLFSPNPLVEVLSLLAAAVVTVVAFVFGAVLLAVVVGLMALAALAFSLRLWWLRRKLGAQANRPSGQHRIIEAEYTVVKRSDDAPDS
jgi:uncharacterized iron-regulated membrane protein